MTNIIGIGGAKRHGKDVIADYLVDEYDYIKLGMSDALAEIMYILNPIIGSEVVYKKRSARNLWRKAQIESFREIRYQEHIDRVGYTEAKEHPEVRRLLQVMGTEVGREKIDINLWTKLMVKKVKEAAKTGAPGVVVTGIRFPNELKAIKTTLNGQLWYVKRDLPASGDTHVSETSAHEEQFDVVIENDSTKNALYSKVDDLLD